MRSVPFCNKLHWVQYAQIQKIEMPDSSSLWEKETQKDIKILAKGLPMPEGAEPYILL